MHAFDADDAAKLNDKLPAGIFNYFDYFRCRKHVNCCALRPDHERRVANRNKNELVSENCPHRLPAVFFFLFCFCLVRAKCRNRINQSPSSVENTVVEQAAPLPLTPLPKNKSKRKHFAGNCHRTYSVPSDLISGRRTAVCIVHIH